jgi:hypothetical protein
MCVSFEVTEPGAKTDHAETKIIVTFSTESVNSEHGCRSALESMRTVEILLAVSGKSVYTGARLRYERAPFG